METCSYDPTCSEIARVKGMCRPHYRKFWKENRPAETRICNFPNCEKPFLAKGLCAAHWKQQHLGRELTPIIIDETPQERFNRNIKKDEISGCWVWLGAGCGKGYNKESGEGGYGQLRIGNKSWQAHRWSYENKHNVKLTPEDTLDHLCRNTRCVNPDHLEKVSRSENIERMHLYWTLRSENERFRKFIQSLGYDPEQILGGDYADVSSI